MQSRSQFGQTLWRAGLLGGAALLAATPGLRGARAAVSGAATASGARVPPSTPRADDMPVRALIHRDLTAPAPEGADAIQMSVLGDGSGALLQVRLLSGIEDGVLTGYYAPPAVPIDFTGWKTLTFPISQFAFHSDADPDADQDGIGDPKALTAPTALQLALTSTSARLYFDDIVWTRAAAAPTDPPLAVIDDFENPASLTAGWKIDGDYSQVRTVIVGGNRIASYVHGGAGSLQFTVRATGEDEYQLNGPTLDARLKRQPKQPYVLYARPPFETITPDDTPTLREIAAGAAISAFTAPGQTEPLTFAVYAGLPIKGATVSLRGSLRSKTGGEIPGSAVSLDVVRDSYVLNGPQLLMKDDRQPLVGPLPTVRLTGDPITDIAAHSSKQFWISVQTPAGQAPGTYTGKLVFQAPGIKPIGVPITVTVLPVTLRTPHYQYGIDLLSVLGPVDSATPGEQTVTPDLLQAELADIRAHGFKMVTLHDAPANLPAALQAYRDSGMSAVGPVVIASKLQSGDFSTVAGLRQSLNLSNDFDIYYRLPADSLANPEAARRYASQAHSADKGALIVASVPSESVYGTLSTALGDELVPLYTLTSDHAGHLRKTGKRATPNRDWWTWSISANDPLQDRLDAGFLLFKTGNGLYGAFPGPYQFQPAGADPYALFSTVKPDSAAAPAPAAPAVQMATFPVAGGVLDTVQWEAVRSGIDDIRYIDALKTISRELKDAHVAKGATDYADSLLIGISEKPMVDLTPTQVQALRKQVAMQTIKLSNLLRKAPAAKPE